MSKSNKSVRHRVGRVSYYQHHGAWWIYYRDDGKSVRRRIDGTKKDVEREAARIHAVQCGAIAESSSSSTGEVSRESAARTRSVSIGELRKTYLEYHESIKRSAVTTIRRYAAATAYLVRFLGDRDIIAFSRPGVAHEFVLFLRRQRVAPNGHPHTSKRSLRDKGVRYILQVCRSMFRYAIQAGLLPADVANPFDGLRVDSLRIDDAKPIFVFDDETELHFLEAADAWEFSLHFVLAKTGMRPGELVHLSIEDVDLQSSVLHVRNKPELAWQTKTRSERSIPIIPELASVLRSLIGSRKTGPVFLRRRFATEPPLLTGDRGSLTRELDRRTDQLKSPTREERHRLAKSVWRDAGALKVDQVRTSFMKTCRKIGLPHSTCPKSWWHTLATLLQDANVDPLVRQTILGHKPSGGSGALGMTSVYTHTRPATQLESLVRATQLWPRSLSHAVARVAQWQGGHDDIA